jgi:FkbM family methyltransferase
MKLLFLSDDFPPQSFGGAGMVAFNLAKALYTLGHSVSVITTVQDKKAEGVVDYEGLKIYRVYANYSDRYRSYLSLYNPQTVQKVKTIINEIKPEIVHSHNIHYFLSYYCLKLAKQSGAKVFLTAHDVMLFHYGKLVEFVDSNDFSCPKEFKYKISPWQQIKMYRKRYNPLRNIIIKYFLKNVDRIFAVSTAMKDALSQNGINNVEVLYNGINPSEWEINDLDVEIFKKKYNLTDKKVVLFGGRLSAAKGGHQAILVMSNVVKEVPEAILLIMGEKNKYAEKMLEIATEMGIDRNIVFTGWVSGNELKAAYHIEDIFLFPSICFESFGLGCIEAMACKKPAVVTCFGGPKEIVVDGKTGYVVNFFDQITSTSKIVDLLKNKTKAEEFGRNGFERVLQEFSQSIQINKTLNYYIMTKKIQPPIPLYLALKFYLILRILKIDDLPKVKGLFKFFYSRVKDKRGVMTITTSNKIKLDIDLADKLISLRLLQYGYWEYGLTKLVTEIVKPGMVAIDVGAHIGYYSTLFSKLVGPSGHVFSFEPDPHNFSFLKSNIELNKISHCIYENKAIYNSNGFIKLNLDSDNLGAHSLVMQNSDNNFITVETVTLDNYFKNQNQKVDFIKMDIEGAEEFALDGARNLIEKNPNITIVMEFMPNAINVIKKMRMYGFKTFIIDHNTGTLEEFMSDEDIITNMEEKGYGLVNILYKK